MLEVGKLYHCEDWILMLYSDKETASDPYVTHALASSTDAEFVIAEAAFLAERLGRPVSYTEKNMPFLVVNMVGDLVELLAGNKKGWILPLNWMNIEEVK